LSRAQQLEHDVVALLLGLHELQDELALRGQLLLQAIDLALQARYVGGRGGGGGGCGCGCGVRGQRSAARRRQRRRRDAHESHYPREADPRHRIAAFFHGRSSFKSP